MVRDGAEAAFAAALTDPARPAPEGLVGPNGKAAAKRFDVYRNNVVVGLVGALEDTFPAVRRIVGEGFFRAAARVHALEEPPRSRLMSEYGRGFPAFLERFEPARSLPYLPDVARIERAWLDAYHAADAAPLAADALGAVPPEALGDVRLTPHPAARVLRSRFAANTIFAMNRLDGPVHAVDPAVPEDTLVARPALDVNVMALPPGGAAFLMGLMDGHTLGRAAAVAVEDAPRFDLAVNIGAMLSAGVFAALAP